MSNAPAKRRPWFQLHLSTCVVLMGVAGSSAGFLGYLYYSDSRQENLTNHVSPSGEVEDLLSAGLGQPPAQVHQPDDVEALPRQQQHYHQSDLYADDEVQRIFEQWTAHDPDDQTFLRVVPAGTSAPLVTVFSALELDLNRLGKPDVGGLHHVVFLTWQVSPSYELSCMTATNDSRNDGVGYTDSMRQVYAIRIGKRD